jgi:hypothetical protein
MEVFVMRKYLLWISLLLSIITVFCSKTSDLLQKAKASESTGNMGEAYTHYTQALLEGSPSGKIPDFNRSKFLEPALWKKEVEKYILWVTTGTGRKSANINSIIEGIKRCAHSTSSVNTLFNLKDKELTSEEYLNLWNKTFFAPNVPVNPDHAGLASGNYIRKLSFITIKGTKNYTYEGALVNEETGCSTGFILYAEGNVTFLAPPGKHILVYRSTAEFPDRKVWRSPYSTVDLDIPEKASLVTAELRTSVSRK